MNSEMLFEIDWGESLGTRAKNLGNRAKYAAGSTFGSKSAQGHLSQNIITTELMNRFTQYLASQHPDPNNPDPLKPPTSINEVTPEFLRKYIADEYGQGNVPPIVDREIQRIFLPPPNPWTTGTAPPGTRLPIVPQTILPTGPGPAPTLPAGGGPLPTGTPTITPTVTPTVTPTGSLPTGPGSLPIVGAGGTGSGGPVRRSPRNSVPRFGEVNTSPNTRSGSLHQVGKRPIPKLAAGGGTDTGKTWTWRMARGTSAEQDFPVIPTGSERTDRDGNIYAEVRLDRNHSHLLADASDIPRWARKDELIPPSSPQTESYKPLDRWFVLATIGDMLQLSQRSTTRLIEIKAIVRKFQDDILIESKIPSMKQIPVEYRQRLFELTNYLIENNIRSKSGLHLACKFYLPEAFFQKRSDIQSIFSALASYLIQTGQAKSMRKDRHGNPRLIGYDAHGHENYGAPPFRPSQPNININQQNLSPYQQRINKANIIVADMQAAKNALDAKGEIYPQTVWDRIQAHIDPTRGTFLHELVRDLRAVDDPIRDALLDAYEARVP